MPRLGQSRYGLTGQPEVQKLAPKLGILDAQVCLDVIHVMPGIGDAVADEHHAADPMQRLALHRDRGSRTCQQRQQCQSLER
jgi:hypothetical protein